MAPPDEHEPRAAERAQGPEVVGGDEGGVARAVEVLRGGGLVALPTETVYGLGADAEQPEAVARIFAAKGRPSRHPLIVHLGDADLLDAWADSVPTEARLLADAFWPGPLTLLLWRSEKVIDEVTGGRPTVGLRVPDHPVALAVLAAFGGGVAAPSANRFGRVSPTTAAHVVSELGPAVDLVVDGGPSIVGVESTIVDLTGERPVVLRPGGISVERLTDVLGVAPAIVAEAGLANAAADVDERGGAARAPGMLAAHYAPSAQVIVVDEGDASAIAATHVADGRTVGVLAPRALPDLPDAAVALEPAGPPEEYARLLYARLRQADRLGLDVLVCVPPPPVGVGVAVIDRLRRAAIGSRRPS
jgi:L-threonylcarbamoyladenylate synthase